MLSSKNAHLSEPKWAKDRKVNFPELIRAPYFSS